VCGDGVVQAPLEQCDDANQDNTDACLNTCLHSTCGDGFVQLPHEHCDDGNQDDADACPGSCLPASCGDGYTQAGTETCDGGGETPTCDLDCTPANCGDGVLNLTAGEVCDDGNDVEDDGCDSACAAQLKIIFVTNQVYTGDLGGLAGADAKCQAAAAAAGLPGTYMAWLSDDTGSPSTRMFRSTGPYVLPDGTRVVDDWSGFTTLGVVLKHPIAMTETQAEPPILDPHCFPTPCAYVWTNTHLGEQLSSAYSCADWTSAVAASAMGNWLEVNEFWTSATNDAPCGFELPLYCFEQ
jgi:cysteine-rich repeat protein